MKLGNLLFVTSSIMLATLPAIGQEANTQVRVKVKGVKLEQQYTPDFGARNVTEKR